MNSVWLTAWVISFFTFAGGYVAFRRCGLSRTFAFTLAAPFFPAPLFIGIGGSNSFIYLVDLLTPWFLVLAMARWPFATRAAKGAAVALLLGVGLIPLMATALVSFEVRPRVMFALINGYRVAGVSALIIMASGVHVVRSEWFHQARFTAAFSWLAALLAVAVVLQYAGLMNSNVFYQWDATRSGPEGMVGATAVAGLFRGSLGIMASLGAIGFLATQGRHRYQEALGLIGAVAGLAMIVIIGSKTSLLLAVLLCGIGTLQAFRSGGRKLGYVLMAMVVSGLSGLLFIDRLPAKYVDRVMGVFARSSSSMETLQFRQSRWSQSWETLQQQPEILFGMGLEEGMDVNLGFYHNEYLAVLMNGGLFSFGFYIAFLAIVFVSLFRNLRADRPVVVFSLLVFMAGLVQGMTVDHIMPALYFASTAGLFGICYGFGLNTMAIQPGHESHLFEHGDYDEERAYAPV